MSTNFRPLTPICLQALFDGRLLGVGVHEHHSTETTANARCLTDGGNFLWVFGDESVGFCAYGAGGSPHRILRAICDAFDVDIVSEHQCQFWGFETEEEWHAAWAREFPKADSGAHGAHDDDLPF